MRGWKRLRCCATKSGIRTALYYMAMTKYLANTFPLLWKHFRGHRAVLLPLAQALHLESSSYAPSLMHALQVMTENESSRQEWIGTEVGVVAENGK